MLCPIFPRLELIITTVIMICQDSPDAIKKNLNGSLKNPIEQINSPNVSALETVQEIERGQKKACKLTTLSSFG